MNQEPREEDALWRRAARGDEEAFRRLVDWLLPRVRRFIYRLNGFQGDVDDLTQEVFVRMIESWKRGKHQASGIAYTLGIAANLVRESRRRAASTPVRDGSFDELDPAAPDASNPSPLSEAVQSEEIAQAQTWLRGLSPTLREVVVLSVYEGLKPGEIAEVLGLKSEAVRHRLFRARQHFRDLRSLSGDALEGELP